MNKIRQKIGKFFDMPKEIVEDTIKITVIDRNYILIENYKNIIDYTENLIKINNNKFNILIEGIKLYLSEMNKNELLISGEIKSILYEVEE